MGSTISSAMEQSQGKMMEKQGEMQSNMLKRQIVMQKGIAARQMAAARARAKDLLHFVGGFAAFAVPVLVVQAGKTGNKALLAPAIILSLVCAYQADMAYGNKMERIRKDAETMLAETPEMFGLPAASSLNLTDIDRAVAAESQAAADAAAYDAENRR
ncbi:hypothetical protein FNF31_01304 [Cafeteria roenbergensis]|uniref:Plasminogen receptor (KT) n=1 Tax=Cafeteria roenbergensis TaxID=33653 RepID=A0A5A8DM90_CAFRO|nr:hypothetical protein FNF31_01304 [Cafeteria roenbergensis]